MKLQVECCRLPIAEQSGGAVNPLAAGAHGVTCPARSIANRKSQIANGFTLVEVMVVVVLLSVIVLALMAVFDSTQTAFRASVTQAGILESGRAAMDLMADDLRAMSPSDGYTNRIVAGFPVPGAANFYASSPVNYASPPSPLIQPLVASSPPQSRTNVLETIFILSRGNQNGVPTWYGVGYAVATNAPSGPLYSLYRFATNHPVAAIDPTLIFTRDFGNYLTNITSGSRLLDGVVDLTVRACAPDGSAIMNTFQTNYYNGQANIIVNRNVLLLPSAWGQTGYVMFSNTLPASVEIEMGVLEDRALQRAESIPNAAIQSNYLAGSAGQVHIFRQRVSIPNVDPSAYQ